jgi:hypothetical protein
MEDLERLSSQFYQKFKDFVVDEKVLLEPIDAVGSTETTDKKNQNDSIVKTPIFWEKAFHEFFLEILDFDTGYAQAKTSYTTAFLENGIHTNPQHLHRFLDMMITRLQHIYMVKRLGNFLGLHNEMDRIIDNELTLIYNRPSGGAGGPFVDRNNPIAGEVRRVL